MPRTKLAHRARPATGIGYACPTHGNLGVDVILLGGAIYCPADDCAERAHLVSRAPQAGDIGRGWNEGGFVVEP